MPSKTFVGTLYKRVWKNTRSGKERGRVLKLNASEELFQPKQRASTAGSILLEAMLAFVVLGMVLTATYSLSVRSMKQQIQARQDYDLTAMAQAILDEYVITYATMPKVGTYKDTWDWRITEASQEVLEPTDYDYYFQFVRITVIVKKKVSNEKSLALSTVVARRGPGI